MDEPLRQRCALAPRRVRCCVARTGDASFRQQQGQGWQHPRGRCSINMAPPAPSQLVPHVSLNPVGLPAGRLCPQRLAEPTEQAASQCLASTRSGWATLPRPDSSWSGVQEIQLPSHLEQEAGGAFDGAWSADRKKVDRRTGSSSMPLCAHVTHASWPGVTRA